MLNSLTICCRDDSMDGNTVADWLDGVEGIQTNENDQEGENDFIYKTIIYLHLRTIRLMNWRMV